MRNLLGATPKSLQPEVYQRVRAILDAPDPDTARLLMNQVSRDYSEKAPKAMRVLEEGVDDVTAVLAFTGTLSQSAPDNQ
jgi:putative transposase